MLAPAVVGDLPLRVNDGPFADFDDAIASAEADSFGGMYKVDVGPLVPMVVNIVGDLGEQNAVRLKHAICFPSKGWVKVAKNYIRVLWEIARPTRSGE